MKIRRTQTSIHRSTTLLMNLAAIVERCDEAILPAVFFHLSKSLNASLSQLGTLILCRAIVQALSSPLSGILGDRFDRTRIVSTGCILWGIMTAAIGFSTSISQAMIACAVNGFGLALVIPCIQSIIADSHPEGTRGRAFGTVAFTSSIGGMLGAFFATSIGGKHPLGIDGWRFAFYLVAFISIITALFILEYARDPRATSASSLRFRNSGSSSSSLNNTTTTSSVYDDFISVVKIRSFQVIILQGIVGMMPWQAIALFTLWLQILGFSDSRAATLVALFSLGAAGGSYLGGIIGDRCSKRFPNHGRILACQLSVLSGLPLSVVLLKGLPTAAGSNVSTDHHHQDDYVQVYGMVLMVSGLLISWCGTNNSVVFSELVPSRLRSTIYAFDRSFEGSIAAFSAPLVGYIAQHVFGFQNINYTDDNSGGEANTIAQTRSENATALGNALLVCLIVPWTLCLLCYTLLHVTYPRDIAIIGAMPGNSGEVGSLLKKEVSMQDLISEGSGGGMMVRKKSGV